MKRDFEKTLSEVRNNFIWVVEQGHSIVWDGQYITLNDHWGLMQPDSRGVLRGDCEDFCLYVSKKLKEKFNISKYNRDLVFCETETGEGHMVLRVISKGVEYVFDNRQRGLATLISLYGGGYKNFAKPDGPINGKWSKLDMEESK